MGKRIKTIAAVASLIFVSTALSGCDTIDKILNKDSGQSAGTVASVQENVDAYTGNYAVSTPQISSIGLGNIVSDNRNSKLSLLSLNDTKGHSAFLRYVITISVSGSDGYLDASVFDLAGAENIKRLYMVNGGNIIPADDYKSSEHGNVIGVRFIVDAGQLNAPTDMPSYLLTNLTINASESITPEYTNDYETVVSIRTQVSSVGGDTDEWITVDESSVSSSDPDSEEIDVDSALENYFIPDIVMAPSNDSSSSDPGMLETNENVFTEPSVTTDKEQTVPAETTVPVIDDITPDIETTTTTTTATEETTTTAAAAETTTASTDIAPTSLSLNTVYIELGIGESYTLTPTFEPSNATQTDLTWSSADPSIATVSNGTVTAVGAGATTISCSTVNGMTLQVSVTVKEAQTTSESNDISAIKLDTSEVRLGVGETYTLSISVEPSSITQLNATWSNTDPGVATIDGSGTITAVGQGTTTITLTADNGVNTYCNIIVE